MKKLSHSETQVLPTMSYFLPQLTIHNSVIISRPIKLLMKQEPKLIVEKSLQLLWLISPQIQTEIMIVMKAISPVVHHGNKGFGTQPTKLVKTILTQMLANSTLMMVLNMIILQLTIIHYMKNNFTAEVQCNSDGQLNMQGLGKQYMVTETVFIFFQGDLTLSEILQDQCSCQHFTNI